MKTELKIILGIALFIGITLFAFNNKPTGEEIETKKYKIINKWEVPKILDEVSGISWIGNEKVACIQDEEGIIFIYNLKTEKIEKEIEFAERGDYEDVVVYENTAYALRSDGVIFMVKNYNTSPKVTKYNTFEDDKRDVEGLTLDKPNNRLLIAVKDEKDKDIPFKGVYEFDLATEKFNPSPIFKINLNDAIFKSLDEKKPHKRMRPSAISYSLDHNEVYVLDGSKPKILVANKNWELIKLYELDKDLFYQPEGITFSPDGRMFISNEGKKGKPNILEVELN